MPEDPSSSEKIAKSLYKNVLKKGASVKPKDSNPNKSGSLVIFTNSSSSLDAIKNKAEEKLYGTPTSREESKNEREGGMSRFTSNLSFNKRSSSIHSIKSSRNSDSKYSSESKSKSRRAGNKSPKKSGLGSPNTKKLSSTSLHSKSSEKIENNQDKTSELE